VTIEQLAELVLAQSREVLARKGYDSQVESEQVNIRTGPKYTKIDRGPHGSSGFLMIENATSDIWGIKGYGVVHKGHHYGTLATAGQWYWGEYRPRKINPGPPSAYPGELHRRNLASDQQEH
jgi:hypothetical protein